MTSGSLQRRTGSEVRKCTNRSEKTSTALTACPVCTRWLALLASAVRALPGAWLSPDAFGATFAWPEGSATACCSTGTPRAPAKSTAEGKVEMEWLGRFSFRDKGQSGDAAFKERSTFSLIYDLPLALPYGNHTFRLQAKSAQTSLKSFTQTILHVFVLNICPLEGESMTKDEWM